MDAMIRRLDRRRELLMERYELIRQMQDSGESSTSLLELMLLADEMQHLRDLYQVRLLMAIKARVDAVMPVR